MVRGTEIAISIWNMSLAACKVGWPPWLLGLTTLACQGFSALGALLWFHKMGGGMDCVTVASAFGYML